jgi:hypothetical protein
MSQRSSLDEARRGLLELAARAAKDLAAKNARPEVAAATVMQKHGVPSAHRPDQQVPLSLRERARVRGPAAEDAR